MRELERALRAALENVNDREALDRVYTLMKRGGARERFDSVFEENAHLLTLEESGRAGASGGRRS
jgi:hypothetical protein